jgi:DNA adenine methylase
LQKTLLRWAGSKKKLLPELTKYYSTNFNTYIEPFVGSGQLFFNLPIERAILSDINKELINMYNVVKTEPKNIFEVLSSFEKGKEAYYNIREAQVSVEDKIANAARFIYLNTYCFNGLYRTNLSGKFNVPYSESSGKLINLDHLIALSQYLQRAQLISGDFEKIVYNNCKENDFVYLDPPYAIKNQKIFNQYSPVTFGLNDLNRLKQVIEHINSIGAKFVLSYADCEEAAFLSEGWRSAKVSTVRNISGFAKHRKRESEVLITNLEL